MTPETIKTNITMVVNTLNGVEVRGRDNMNKLLGCILTLENLAVKIGQEEEAPETEDNHD